MQPTLIIALLSALFVATHIGMAALEVAKRYLGHDRRVTFYVERPAPIIRHH